MGSVRLSKYTDTNEEHLSSQESSPTTPERRKAISGICPVVEESTYTSRFIRVTQKVRTERPKTSKIQILCETLLLVKSVAETIPYIEPQAI